MTDEVSPTAVAAPYRYTRHDIVSPMDTSELSFTPMRSPGMSSSYFGINLDGETLRDVDSRRVSVWDKRDMKRLGRTQQMRRSYRSLSMLSFTIVVQATWEFVLVSMYNGLYDGGLAGMVYSFIWTTIGFLPIVASLAEMASMSPTSGGQYHWVSEFAPESMQRTLSYFVGWLVTLAWQAGNAAGIFATGTLIQALILENNASYISQPWQGTLLVIANAVLVLVLNIWGSRIIPFVQNGLFCFHILLLSTILIPLWFLAPHASTTDVFATFYNGGDWQTVGLSVLIGQISAIWGCLGSDTAAHMAEEVKDAGLTVPNAMFWSYIVNTTLGILLIVTVCFAIPDLPAALDDTSGYPFLWALRNGLSNPAPTVLTSGVLVSIFASNMSYLASTARETFAFARDQGFPFSGWLATIDNDLGIPRNALFFTFGITVALSLINIGSSTAFNAIISLNASAIMLSYTISIGCVLWRRIRDPDTLPLARWSLGRWGITLNVLGVVYGVWTFFWSLWPIGRAWEAKTFNWASIMFVAVAIFSALDFWWRGRFVYRGPVTLIEGRKST